MPEPSAPGSPRPGSPRPAPRLSAPAFTEAAVTAPTVREAAGLLRILPVPALWPRSVHVVERHARVYRHAWLMLASGLLEPLFYLLSIGIGLGHLVGHVTGPLGHPVAYTAYVAPALLASSSMNGAIYDSTFNVFFRLKYAKLYDAALATPMRPGDIALGEITWALIRGGMYACAFMVIMLADGPGALGVGRAPVPVALLIGFAFAATGMAGTTYMRSWQHFEFVMLATLPMFLFSASFYPLTVYPKALRIVVECTPLYQGVALLRDLTLGAVGPGLLLARPVPGGHGSGRPGHRHPPHWPPPAQVSPSRPQPDFANHPGRWVTTSPALRCYGRPVTGRQRRPRFSGHRSRRPCPERDPACGSTDSPGTGGRCSRSACSPPARSPQPPRCPPTPARRPRLHCPHLRRPHTHRPHTHRPGTWPPRTLPSAAAPWRAPCTAPRPPRRPAPAATDFLRLHHTMVTQTRAASHGGLPVAARELHKWWGSFPDTNSGPGVTATQSISESLRLTNPNDILYAPTMTPANNSCIEVVTVHTTTTPQIWAWDWCKYIRPVAVVNVNAAFMKAYTIIANGRTAYTTKDVQTNAKSNTWTAYLFNYQTGNWDRLYTQAGTDQSGLTFGWDMFEFYSSTNPATGNTYVCGDLQKAGTRIESSNISISRGGTWAPANSSDSSWNPSAHPTPSAYKCPDIKFTIVQPNSDWLVHVAR